MNVFCACFLFLLMEIGSTALPCAAQSPAQDSPDAMALPAPVLLSPAHGAQFHHYPRLLEFQWEKVPGASSYAIEIEMECSPARPGCGNGPYAIRELEVPGLIFTFWDDRPGRWRVWASSPTGDGIKSEWRNFAFDARGAARENMSASKRDCSWRKSIPHDPEIVSARPIFTPAPEYAQGAEKVNAVVSLEVKVGTEGQVENICILSSPRADLDEVTAQAVKNWRFAPAHKGGDAVPGIAHLEFRFRACCDAAVLFYPPSSRLAAQQQTASISAPHEPTSMTRTNSSVPAQATVNSQCPSWPRTGEPLKGSPKAIYTPDPSYTEAARRAKISGQVSLWLKVGNTGAVDDACVDKSLRADLDQAAVQTVKTWRFEPVMKDGVAVGTTIAVFVTFSLY
ncbi:MAG TPA: energy transducer TonB [Candidatus Angelobacter sp.]|nr:energy transducer TonB [Candidatus Angelobacter sp.]